MLPVAVPALMAGGQIAGSLFSGLMGSNASEKAARQQAEAQQAALDFQKQVYGDAQSNLNPYIQSGTRNLGEYQNRLANTTQPTFGYTQDEFAFDKWKDPGAQYMAQQAAQAQGASALAKGAMGGGFAKSLATNQSNLANTAYAGAYDRWLNNSKLKYGQAADQYNRDYTAQQATLDRYGNLAGQGLSAANMLMGGGQAAAGNVGQLYGQMGSANAAGTMGSANSWMNAVQGAGSGLASGLGQYYGGMSGQYNPYGDMFQDWGNA